MATITVGPTYAFNSGTLKLSSILMGVPTVVTSSQLSIEYNGFLYTFLGSGVTYDSTGSPVTGVISELKVARDDGALAFDATQLSVSAKMFGTELAIGDDVGALALLLNGPDTFIGGPQGDVFRTSAISTVTLAPDNSTFIPVTVGPLTVDGGAGDDTLYSAFAGPNTLILSGSPADYTITHNIQLGMYTIKDNRAGSPDGTDTAYNFKFIRFANQTLPIESSAGYTILASFTNVLRLDPNSANFPTELFNSDVQKVEGGIMTMANVASQLASIADSTTAVATLSYQFFTGATPTPAGLDYLVSPAGGNPNNLNSAYYSQFSTTNRYINFASNLGKIGAGAAAFQAAYGGLSLADATSKAYAAIFGSTPTADKVNHLLSDLVPDGHGGTYARTNYFAFYGGDGPSGIGTKAAMVGWLIAQADSAHVGTLETADMAYLLDLAAGRITGSVDLVGSYHGTAYTGG